MANKRMLPTLLGAALALSVPAWAEDTVKIVDICELSGSGAVDGTNWHDGIDMAVAEINASGGILGRKIEMIHYDSQSDAGVARTAMQKAVDADPYVIMGPVLSFEARVTMGVAQQAKIPEFSGGESSDLTAKKNPYFFRTSLSQQFSLPMIAQYMHENLHAKTIMIFWENDDTGRSTRDVLTKEAAALGMQVIADQPGDNNQVDFAADVVRAKTLNPDVIYAHLQEQATARFLQEIHRQGVTTPLVGDTTLMAQTVIQMAGPAADGVRGWVGLSPVVPDPGAQAFVAKFTKTYGRTPDHNAMKSYMAVYAIKYATTKIGKFDREALGSYVHGMTVTPQDEPGMFIKTSWDDKGNVDRESFIVTVEDGRQKVLTVLPPHGTPKQ